MIQSTRGAVQPVLLFLMAASVSCGDDVVGSTSDSDGASDSDAAATTAGPTGSESEGEPACAPGEQQACACDGGAAGLADCLDDGSGFGECQCPEPACGNGQVEEGEGCDDGPANADDAACTSACQPASCGDGLVHAGVEACDDGVNDDSYGGCAPDCSLADYCGDGAQNGPPDAEACDDGDDVNGDGCNVDCVVSGTPLWTDVYPGEDAGNSIAHGVAVDSSGDVFVVGETFVVGENANIMIRKYSSEGELLWSQSIDGPGGGVDAARGVAIDREDNIVVVGEVFEAGNNADIWIRKADNDGNELWTLQINGDDGLGDAARGVAVDADDNIIVTGESYHLIGLTDVWTAKFGPEGDEWWINEYDHEGGNDGGYGVSVGQDGQIFVVGGAYAFIGLDDFFLRSYSPVGVIEWTQTIDNWGGVDRGRAAAVDGEGNLVMVGETYTPDDLTNIWIGGYSAVDGEQLWVEWFDSDGADNDIGYGVAVDGDGNVVVAGSTYAIDTLADAIVLKYSAGVEPLWQQIHMGPAGNDRALAVAVDAYGNIYAAGSEYSAGDFANLWLTKYAP
ncbi:MAG: hypothetical protein H6713_21840 [Myxococcales bacterium]|nr:hypothetical protein [Myxococcales bacterium]MCB9752605.1 hypothetical protein [Myxococcales bacterium]